MIKSAISKSIKARFDNQPICNKNYIKTKILEKI